jgi:hypothetical protein
VRVGEGVARLYFSDRPTAAGPAWPISARELRGNSPQRIGAASGAGPIGLLRRLGTGCRGAARPKAGAVSAPQDAGRQFRGRGRGGADRLATGSDKTRTEGMGR